MADLMKFLSNIQRTLKLLPGAVEPTIPGVVSSDIQRIWNGYPVINHEALNPGFFNDINSIFVDSVLGDDSNPGTLLLPVKSIQKAISISFIGKDIIVLKGLFYERVVVGSYYVTPYVPVINSTMVHIASASGEIAYIKAPDFYDPPEEYQQNWDLIPGYPQDLLLDIYFGCGMKGDYIQQSNGNLRYLLPNAAFTNNVFPATETRAYQFYVDDGHEIIKNVSAIAEWFPNLKQLKEIQHFGFQSKALGLFVNPYGMQNAPYGYYWYDPAIHPLTHARDPNPLFLSDDQGIFYFSAPDASLQIHGTTGVTPHIRGASYSGWILSICRTKLHPGRILAAQVSFNTADIPTPGSGGNLISEKIHIMKYSIGVGWELFDEWISAPIIRVIQGTVVDFVFNFYYLGLKAVYDKVYWMNSIPKITQYSDWNGEGEIRVSTGGSFTSITINGEKKAEDFEYYKGNYFCTCKGKLYRSANGISNWIQIYSDDHFYFMKMSVINEVLFFSIATGVPKKYAYSYDGMNIIIRDVPLVLNRNSVLGGLVFQSNGRVIITHAKSMDSGIYMGNPPPAGGDIPYSFISFQESLLNYEKSDDTQFFHIDNIDFSGKNSSGNIASGSCVTEGRGWNQ